MALGKDSKKFSQDRIHRSEEAHYDRLAETEGQLLSSFDEEASDMKYHKGLRMLGICPEDLRGKEILECGCGTGKLALYLAKQGAYVSCFDISPQNIQLAIKRAKAHGYMDRIKPEIMAFENLSFDDGSFDIVFGVFILHHVTDISAAARQVMRVLKPDGNAYFIETSATNKILIFLRNHLVGRLGVPKRGTEHEHPITDNEIGSLMQVTNGRCRVRYPNFNFFGVLSFQLFKDQIKPVAWLTKTIDDALYFMFPFLRKYSYNFLIEFHK